MIIERIIFNVVAFALFFVIFLKMIYKNDSNYIYITGVQALGIAISFIGLVFRINLPITLLTLTYILSILLPIVIIIIEKNGLLLSEIIAITFAHIYIKMGKQERATKILLDLLEKYSNSYYAHKMLAEIYEKQEKIEVAIDEYRRVIEINKGDYKSYYNLSYLLNKYDNKEEAKIYLKIITSKKPEMYEAVSLLGDILYEQENFKEALNVYLDALQYNMDNYDLYYNIGMIYTRLNDFQSAKEYYEKAAQLNSLLYHAKYDLGQILLLHNEEEEASQYFEECLEDKELEQDAYYYLGYISMLKGDRYLALQYLNMAVQDNYRIYEKAKKEKIFIIISNKINKPNKTVKENQYRTLTKKEINTMIHLENTYELVGSLNRNDLKAIKIIKDKLNEENKEREME